jgi:hypothetical protein
MAAMMNVAEVAPEERNDDSWLVSWQKFHPETH